MSPGEPDSPDRSCQEPVSTVRRHEQFPDVPSGSIQQGPTPKDSPTFPDSRYSTPLWSYVEAFKHAKTLSPLSREYMLPLKGR